ACTPLLAARRRVRASQPEATRQRRDSVVGDRCEPVPCGHRIVEGTRCGGVVEPFDALAERGTHCEVLLQRTPGGLSFVLAARAAPGLVEDLIAGLVEPMRHVFPGLDVTRDTRPLLLDGTDLLGRLEEVARDGQLLDHETELDLPGALGGEGAQVRVGLALCQAVEPLGVFELLDGDPPNPRIRIAPRDRFQARLVTDAHLAYRRGPDLRVGSTPAGP